MKLIDIKLMYWLCTKDEMAWKRKKLDKKNYSFYFSSQNELYHFGTRFVVKMRIRDKVINFEPANERVGKIRIKPQNISIICVHAPREGKEEIEKEMFYDKLEETCNKCPPSNIRSVIGDLYAKVGRISSVNTFTGRHSLHESNENGNRLLNFTVGAEVFIGSPCFTHRYTNKATWHSLDGKVNNQIDLTLNDEDHSRERLKPIVTADDSEILPVLGKKKFNDCYVGKKNFKKYFLDEDSLVASYEWIRDSFQDTPEGLSTSEEEIFIDFTSSEKVKGNFVINRSLNLG
ncbi:putative endonuclease-reverse transcriptase [Trichonephila clavipes]|nr:putative endonuclease-reverse transcriptase [Trichonephila clavipes]